MREPLHSLAAFSRFHQEQDAKIKKYYFTPRGAAWFSARTVEELKDRNSSTLFSVNKRARIAVAREMLPEIEYVVGEHEGRCHYVTLAPKDFALPLTCASEFDAKTLKRWAREILHGYDYVACVEAAYYHYSIVGREPTVSWHVHAIVWGCSQRRIGEVIRQVNASYESLVPGIRPADRRQLTLENARRRVLYTLKSPRSEYKVYPLKEEWVDPETGEILIVKSGKFRQRKDAIRPGVAVKMASIMIGRRLPDLVFGGGEGVPIVCQVLRRARRRIRRLDQRHIQKLRSLLG